MNVESRLRAIEEQNAQLHAKLRLSRRVVSTFVMISLSIACLTFFAGAQATTPQVVEARAFVLKDAAGRTIGHLGSDGAGPFFKLFDKGDYAAIDMHMQDNRPLISISDGKSGHLDLMCLFGGPEIWLGNKNGRPMAQLVLPPDDQPYLTLTGPEGISWAHLRSTPTGPAIELRNRTGRRRAWMNVDGENGELHLLNGPAASETSGQPIPLRKDRIKP